MGVGFAKNYASYPDFKLAFDATIARALVNQKQSVTAVMASRRRFERPTCPLGVRFKSKATTKHNKT